MDDLPYRNNAVAHTRLPGVAQVSSADEREFSTLKNVRDAIAGSVEDLYKDFNAFDVTKAENEDEAIKALLYQIKGKQEAYTILSEALEVIDQTMQTINLKYQQR